ncbi:hypothetical protein C8R47DRAFT_1229785 [Mycena vitilis]|nr:hypothetical protein C8R47DRAFT_1229785 [Mycena vitilis]
MLGQILASAARLRFKSQPIAKLPAQELPANIEVESEIINGAHTALPPRRPGETLEEFGQRAEATLNRKGRVAAAFAAPSVPRDERVPDPVRTDENRGFTARFEDVGSISTAPRRPNLHTMASSRPATAGGNSLSHTGYLTANEEDESQGDVFEAFRRETDNNIAKIIDKHLGEELNLPAKIKAPRLDSPPKFTGVDDHPAFIRWLEKLVSWMRTMFYGGSDPDTDKYRVSILKNLLEGIALQWYIDFVDSPAKGVEPPEDFIGVVCALHRRFITTATAHQALRDFEAIRFKHESGPLKLMDELEASSKQLREPMPDVIIRQRFMRLIPPALHEDLQALRGISATYSTITQMRTHSGQLWDVRPYGRGANRARTHTTNPTEAATKSTNTPRRVTAPDARPKATTTSTASHAPTPRTGAGLPSSEKTCYKCGIYGHIANDPACPKFTDPQPFRERPRVGAQRVLDSYAADDDELAEEMQGEPMYDDYGGSQYDDALRKRARTRR